MKGVIIINRKYTFFTIFFLVCIIIGCSASKPLLLNKIDTKHIDKIQIVMAMGNPKYGAESRIISNQNEIRLLVGAFNNAIIGKKVKDNDIAISDTSKYIFYHDNNIVQQFFFNGNDSERIWHNSDWYFIKYTDMSPYNIYKDSVENVIIVDKNLQEIK